MEKVMFHQRPLKSQKGLIGTCDLMPDKRRAPIALRVAQRFRMLQKVNDLLVYLPNGDTRPLSEDERQRLLAALATKGTMKFTAVRSKKCLRLPNGTRFNLEEGGETNMPGHGTDATLASVFGDRWPELSETQRDQVVEDLLSFEKAEPLAERAKRHWGLDEAAARKLAAMTLEPGYSGHCRKALTLLVERMEDGTSYATARKDIFGHVFQSTEPADLLPPVRNALPTLRNPAVCRALTELRKVVNAIIRRHGKPEKIRIELARDLKRPRKQRVEMTKRNRAREQKRTEARKILENAGIVDPKSSDIEKYLLAEECRWLGPYTGKPISMSNLFGDSPQFDVEHILPLSRSLDNTFLNKTLCHHEENRQRKRNLTPLESYGANPERWAAILARVKRFTGDAARLKLRRFQIDEIPDGFTERQLQDTRYASRLAAAYLARLYGGRSDEDRIQRIQVSTGAVTNHLRNEWRLNAILSDGGTKSRDDHRHHAVDAIAIALAGPSTVKKLSDAARRAHTVGRRLFAPIEYPWSGFLEDARRVVEGIHVSHRASRKIAGALEAGSNYSRPINPAAGKNIYHIRKELHKLTAAEINGDQIVDPVVRAIVQTKYAGLGGGAPNKVFADPANHPYMTSRKGRKIAIHKVRLRAKVKNVWTVGEGARARHVTSKPGSNHHAVITATVDANGDDTKWHDEVVTRFEVYGRFRRREPIVQRGYADGRQFRFSLVANDHLLMYDDAGVPQLYRVVSISNGDIELRLHTDARKAQDVKKAKARVRCSGDQLRKRRARKVRVTYLGDIVPAHD